MDYAKRTRDEKTRKDMVHLIKRRLYEDIWRRMQRCGETSPPFIRWKESSFLKDDRRTEIRETADVRYGHLEVKDDRFIMHINKRLGSLQKRTLIGHELGHTFLFDVESTPIKPYFDRDRSLDLMRVLHNNSYAYRKEEAFMYEIGQQILVPSEPLGELVPTSPSLGAFMQACGAFLTTKELMARRLFHSVYNWEDKTSYWKDCILIMYETSYMTSNDYAPPERDKVFKGSSLKGINVRKELWPSLPPILRLAYKRPNQIVNSWEYTDSFRLELLEARGMQFDVEALHVPRRERRIYLVLCARESDTPKKPASLFLFKKQSPP